MSIRCRLGWHDRGVTSHRLGQPWTWDMHCHRCGNHWTDSYWLPPQPITCNHSEDHRFHIRPPMTVNTPDGPRQREWIACRICRDLQSFEQSYGRGLA